MNRFLVATQRFATPYVLKVLLQAFAALGFEAFQAWAQ
jgi:hypothetical protein